jgi:hypothetical protein
VMKIKSGGGIGGNKVVQSQSGWKQEPKPKAVSVPAAAQLGMAAQFRKGPLEVGPGYTTKPMAATGIGKATSRPDTPGPGSGRTTYASGSQGQYGPVNPGIGKGAPRDILSEYGKDIPGRR